MPLRSLIAKLISTEPRTLTVSVRQAARITGLGQTTVKKLVRTGELESRKVGTRRVISLASLQRLVEISPLMADKIVSSPDHPQVPYDPNHVVTRRTQLTAMNPKVFENALEFDRQKRLATDPDIFAGKLKLAIAEGAARANTEAAAARGSNAALANVPVHLIPAATAAATKAGEDYAQSKSVSDHLSAVMDAASSGNVVAYQLIPQEGALQVTTIQGMHRIKMAEIQNYGARLPGAAA